jgi:toxin ParE1/3/4
MAKVIWTESALLELDLIAQYISLDKPSAAKKLVKAVLHTVKQLELFPESGRKPPEINHLNYLEIIVKPCRIFYRIDGNKVYIVYIMRSRQDLKKYLLNS